MTYYLTIQGTLPNLNDYTKACRTNRFAGAKLKQDTETMIGYYILSQLRGKTIDNPVDITFSWFEPNKKRDKDNIAFAKKFILDALVGYGILQNDGWSNINGFTDEFYIDKNNPRVEVNIYESAR